MIKWIKQNRIEAIVLLIIILLSTFLRFYRLPEYMTFLGDEGRDALMIKRILIEHDFPLLGPPTSVGNMYLGPLYYYMMAIPMSVWWLNPVAAAGMVATIGVAAVVLVYYLARQWFGFLPAVVSAVLYAISPVNIIYSRSSWNPNPAPFFALLSILGIYKARKSGDFRWFILTGGAFAFALQMHYLALILLPVFILLWFYELILKIQGTVYSFFISGTIGAIVLFFLLMSPLVIFDIKYNFVNYRALTTLFIGQDSSAAFDFFSNLSRVVPIYSEKLVGRYMGAENQLVTILLSLLILIPILLLFFNKIKGRKIAWSFFVLTVWLIVGLFGLSLYKHSIYDHYLGFLNPVPFLLLGATVGYLGKRGQVVVVASFLTILGILNLQQNPLLLLPNNQLIKTQQIAKFIIDQTDNKPFNFALISQNNYDAAYQFYLEMYGHKPKVVPVEITDQLFVVCEDPICRPVGHPKYEIAGFGWVKIEQEQEVSGVRIYKLVENPEGRNSRPAN